MRNTPLDRPSQSPRHPHRYAGHCHHHRRRTITTPAGVCEQVSSYGLHCTQFHTERRRVREHSSSSRTLCSAVSPFRSRMLSTADYSVQSLMHGRKCTRRCGAMSAHGHGRRAAMSQRPTVCTVAGTRCGLILCLVSAAPLATSATTIPNN